MDGVVTTLTVVRNCEKTVARTLRSISEQRCNRARHIIVDGMSSDKTFDVVQELTEPSWQVHRRNDRGYYDSLNFALEKVETPFFITVNGDDELLPGTLEAFCAFLDKNPTLPSETLFGINGHLIVSTHRGERRITGPTQMPPWAYTSCPIATPAFFYSTRFVRKLGGFDDTLRIASDLEIAIAARRNNGTITRWDHTCARMAPGGLSSQVVPLIKESFVANVRAGRDPVTSCVHVGRLAISHALSFARAALLDR